MPDAGVASEIELARALMVEQRADEALQLLQATLRRHPHHPELLRALATSQGALGRQHARLGSAEAVLAASPDALEPALELAEALDAVWPAQRGRRHAGPAGREARQ